MEEGQDALGDLAPGGPVAVVVDRAELLAGPGTLRGVANRPRMPRSAGPSPVGEVLDPTPPRRMFWIRYSGSPLRPRCPVVVCWTRRRTSSTPRPARSGRLARRDRETGPPGESGCRGVRCRRVGGPRDLRVLTAQCRRISFCTSAGRGWGIWRPPIPYPHKRMRGAMVTTSLSPIPDSARTTLQAQRQLGRL